MMTHKRTSKRKFGAVLVLVAALTVGSVVAVPPRQAHALDGGGSLALFGKEIADIVGWIFGDKILAAISNQTIQWANSGFGDLTISVDPGSLETVQRFQEGDMTFLENPEEFFQSLGDDVSRYFFQELQVAADDIFPAFRDEIMNELALNVQESNSPFVAELSATITEEDLDRFIDDFTEGDWSTFLELTEAPQNYFDGALLAAQNELERLQAEEIEQNQQELAQSGGFLSIRRCATSKFTDGAGAGGEVVLTDGVGGTATADPTGCLEYENVTPGKLIGDKVASALQSDTNRTQAADEITEIIALLVTRVLDSLIEEGFSELAGALEGRGLPDSTSEVEAEGERQLAEQQGALYRSQNDGTGDAPPPPPPPGTSEDDDTTAPDDIPTLSVERKGSYWAEIEWNEVDDTADEPAEGYIIYRFEDKSRIRTDSEGNIVRNDDDEPIIDAPNGSFDGDETKTHIATKSFENGTLSGSGSFVYTDSSLESGTRYGYTIIAYDSDHNRTRESQPTFTTTLETTDPQTAFETNLDLLPIISQVEGECETVVRNTGPLIGSDMSEGFCNYEVGAYWVSLNGGGEPEYVDANSVPEFLVYYGIETNESGRWAVVPESTGVLRYGGDSNSQNGRVEELTLESVAVGDESVSNRVFVRVDTTNKVNETSEGNNDKTVEFSVGEAAE